VKSLHPVSHPAEAPGLLKMAASSAPAQDAMGQASHPAEAPELLKMAASLAQDAMALDGSTELCAAPA
jgi:hypothetical protein